MGLFSHVLVFFLRAQDDCLWEELGALIKKGHMVSLNTCPTLLPTLLEHNKLDLVFFLLASLRDVPSEALASVLTACLPSAAHKPDTAAALAHAAAPTKNKVPHYIVSVLVLVI